MKKWTVGRKSSSRKLVFVLALALIGAGVFVGAGTRAFAQQPYGVAPPSGTSWVLTFDDEFTQDSGMNEGLWNGGASNTDWCSSGGWFMFDEPQDNQCQDYFGNITLDPYYGAIMNTAPLQPDAAMTTGGPDQYSAKFIQRFGYWEASFEVPSNLSGEGNGMHSDFWMHPIPEDVASDCTWSPEINVGERPTWYDPLDNTYMSFGVNDCYGSSEGVYAGDGNGDDLSQGFHIYGMQWVNDGSAHGSIYMYLDGNQVFGPHTLNSADWNADDGIYIFLNLDNGDWTQNPPQGLNYNGSSFNVQYVRAWQAE